MFRTTDTFKSSNFPNKSCQKQVNFLSFTYNTPAHVEHNDKTACLTDSFEAKF